MWLLRTSILKFAYGWLTVSKQNWTRQPHPALIHRGAPISIEGVLSKLPELGHHGALEPAEGAVWRVERDVLQPRGGRARKVDFLTKYVKPGKVDGCYLDGEPIWNSHV